MASKTQQYKDNSSGFTLIELMIVIAIIGIIAGIGYPSYAKYLQRGGRAEASALLLEVMEKQEQYYRSNLKYTTSFTDLGYSAAPQSESGRYIIDAPAACTGASLRRCVVLQASAQNNQTAGDDLTLDSRGVKGGKW